MNKNDQSRNLEISNILDQIRHSPDISRSDICKRLGISPASTTRIVTKLLNQNLIYEADELESENVGRKATRLVVNSGIMKFAGIEISDIYVSVCAVDFGGNLIYSDAAASSQNSTLREKLQIAKSLLEKSGYKCKAVGIACIGTVDTERKIIDYCDILGWEKLDAGTIAGEEFNLPIYIDNDVKCDLKGEYSLIKDETYQYITLISFGRGVASATMEYNCIQRGFMNVSGEIGHTIIEYSDGKMCSCGMRGCASTVLNESSIIREARKNDRKIETLSQIWKAFTDESMWAIKLIDKISNYIAVIIRNIVCMQNPQCIILRGSLFTEMPSLYEMVLDKYKFFAYYPLKKFNNFRPGKLGKEAASFGAAIMAMEEYSRDHSLFC